MKDECIPEIKQFHHDLKKNFRTGARITVIVRDRDESIIYSDDDAANLLRILEKKFYEVSEARTKPRFSIR